MIRKFSEKLLAGLRAEVARVKADEQDAFKVLTAVLRLVRAALRKLKDFYKGYVFQEESERVWFFKELKPAFECLRIYELELYHIVSDLPPGDAALLREVYRRELLVVERFFRHTAFHYRYYQLGATDLDSLLFVPGVTVQSVLVPEAPELDPECSTAGSYLFAKFRAFEMLREELVARLSGAVNGADVAGKGSVGGAAKAADVLLSGLPKWTGEQVNLVELAYGLFYTGQLDNGNAEVKDIIALLELVFKIKLNSAYHVFGNIRRRKSVSPSKFLDRMREAILQRVDEDLSYKPNRGIRLKNPPEK